MGKENSTFTRPSQESIHAMRYLRDMLSVVEQEIPQVRGLAFFGSRPRGKERKDPTQPSDLDTVVFYDGSEYTYTGVSDKDRNVIPGFIETNEQLQLRIKQRMSDLMRQRGLPVDIQAGVNKTVFVEDISPSSTGEALLMLQIYVNANEADKQIPFGVIDSHAFRLASRFLIGVGDALYQNRRYVLDKLEEMELNGKQGEKYFRGLMNCVQVLQMKDVETSAKPPQTILEARTVFRIK